MHPPLTPSQRRWRRLRRALQAVVAFVIIGTAVIVATIGLATPWIVSHPEKVQAFLEERLKRPVRFARLSGNWERTGPVFTLEGLEIHEPDGVVGEPFRIDRTQLAINLYSWLGRDRSFAEFRLVGIQIDAVRGIDGKWQVARLGSAVGGGRSAGLDVLLDIGGASLREARLSVQDAGTGRHFEVARLDARFVGSMTERKVGGIAWTALDSAPIKFACALDADADGHCYVSGDSLEPARWLPKVPMSGIVPVAGSANVGIWIDWDDGPREVQLELEANDLVLRGVTPIEFGDGDLIEPRFSLPHWRMSGRWEVDGDGWRLELEDHRSNDDAPDTALVLASTGAADARRYVLDVPSVELAHWLPFAALSDAPAPKLRLLAYESAPSGRLDAVHVERTETGYDLRAKVTNFGLRPGLRKPGLEGLSGELVADQDAVVFMPDPEAKLRLDYPHVFRWPLEFVLHSATLAAARTPEGWQIEAANLDLDGDGFGIAGRARLLFDADRVRPTLDAGIVVKSSSVPGAKRFWPVNVMPEKTKDWLDRALTSGRVAQGSAIVHGDLDDWPFVLTNSGRFEARADIVGVDLDYKPGWPRARLDAAEAIFINNSMDVRIDAAEVAGNAVSPARATIERFREPILKIDAEGQGSGESLLGFLAKSPLHVKTGMYLIGVTLGGSGRFDVDLDLPLKPELGLPTVRGSVLLTDADLADAKWGLRFGKASGRVRFTEKGFAADDLTVRLGEDVADFSIASGAFTSDPAHTAEASLRGDLHLDAVMSAFTALDEFRTRVPGRSEWAMDLTVGVPGEDGTSPKTLTLRSDLVGTAVDLPAPLRKDRDSALPVRVAIGLPTLGGRAEVELGKLARMVVLLPGPEQSFAGLLNFGVAEIVELPEEGLRVRGDAPAIDVGGWGELAGGGLTESAGGGGSGKDDTFGPLDVDLRAGVVVAGGRAFEDTRLMIRQDANATAVTLVGDAIKGRVTLPRGAAADKTIVAEFDKLHVPEARPGAGAANPMDPARLPPLRFTAKDLRLGTASFGAATIVSKPIPGGMRLEPFETKSPAISISAKGDWKLVDGAERSDFDIEFSSSDLGKMLESLGFAGMIEGGRTAVQLDGAWSGSPAQFSLAKVDGVLEGKVGKGSMTEIKPGAGRFFGLLSVQALPRRLSLDFSDFFESGLAFDSIEGKFRLAQGNAFTENLSIKGPSVDIRVSGRTGLARRDYDQELQVTPKVGSVLPVAGALAGGPVGAAAGFVLQNVLPINQVARARYKVTGSWEKPEVTLLAKEKVAPEAGGSTPRGGG